MSSPAEVLHGPQFLVRAMGRGSFATYEALLTLEDYLPRERGTR